MTLQTSRRSFLGLSALGLAAAVAPGELVHPPAAVSKPENEASNVSPEISVWVTAGEERFAAAPKTAWRPASAAPGTDQIRLNPGTKFQKILGFGGAFTDAACYTFNQLAPAPRERLFHELFHPSEMMKANPTRILQDFPSSTTANTFFPCCARRDWRILTCSFFQAPGARPAG